ncbi:MAG: hypothetical protein R2824_35415, partial [Saprospiraceae bacterium]
MKPTPKIVTLTFLSLFAAICLEAQTFPPRDISLSFGDPDTHEISRKIMQTKDGYFLIAGTAGSGAFMMKISACGDTLWNKTWQIGSKAVLNDIGELSDGQLIATGHCENCAIESGDSADKILLIKTTASGETVQLARLGTPDKNALGQALAVTPDDDIMITGQTLIGSLAGNRVHLYRINSIDLSVRWQHFYDQMYLDYANDLTMASDGSFLIAGWSNNIGGAEYFTAYRISDTGQLIWAKKWNLNGLTTGVTHRAGTVKQSEGRDISILGTVYMDTLRKEEVLITNIDLESGDTLSLRTFGTSGNDKGNDLHLVNGEEYLIAWDEGADFSAHLSQLNATFEEIRSEKWDHPVLAYYIPSIVPVSEDGKDYAVVRNQVVYLGQWDFHFIAHSTVGHHARFSDMPQSDQLYPRDPATNQAMIKIGGMVGQSSQYTGLSLSVYRNDQLTATLDYPLQYTGDSAAFAFEYTIPAELKEYAFKIWGTAGDQKYHEAEACGVVAGDVYLVYGQSNAVAGASNFDRDVFIRNFGRRNFGDDTLTTWHRRLDDHNPYPFIDKQPGNWAQRLAKNIIEQHQIPIAVINGAVGGQVIENLTADPYNHFNPSTIYGQWLTRVDQAGIRNK